MPTIEPRRLHFYSSGLRLAGALYLPAGEPPVDGWPALVFCHGFTAVKELYLPPLATAMAKAGLAALTFDYRGFGESDGPPGRLIPDEQVEDARNAITCLQAQPGVDRGRIGLFGTSFGGGIAVAAAARDARARLVVSSVGVGHGGRWLRSMRPYWAWVAFLRELEADRVQRVLDGTSRRVDRGVIAPPDPAAATAHRAAQAAVPTRLTELPLETAEAVIEWRPEALVHRLSPRPLLVIMAARDTRVPPEQSLRLFERAREPKSLVVLEGVEHHEVYEPPARDRLLAAVLSWLPGRLDPSRRASG
jgi:dipeptidyl aminopeptidase/acylaminoacyl peptidase